MATIVSDIDGTIVAIGGGVIETTAEFLRKYRNKYDIVLITARGEARRAATVARLRRLNVPYDQLLMNNVGATHQDGLESKHDNIEDLPNVVLAIDNDADVRRLYTQMGVRAVAPSDLPGIELP